VAPIASLAHDAAEGGLAVACAGAAIMSGVGAELDLPADPVALFGEGGGQALIACAPADVDRVSAALPVRELGVVGGELLAGLRLSDLEEAWST
jgi:phosphoribosylformylglycinamidine (FGAM) synthase-like enzyme